MTGKRLFSSALLSFFAILFSLPAAEPLKVVRIGVCLSTSGEFGASGRKYLAGVKLRQEDFNSRSSEHGMRLDLVIRDDMSNAERTKAVVRELAAEENVPAIIGPLSSNQMLAAADTVRELGVVFLSPSSTSPKIGKNGDWCFRVLFDDQFQGVALARFVARKLNVRRAGAIVNERLAYSNSVFETFKATFEQEGGDIVSQEYYNWVADEDQRYDFASILKRISKVRPDVVILPVNSVEVAAIVRASLEAGVKARFCGGDTWQHENILYASGNNIENSFYISGVNYESGSPAMQRFLRLYDSSNDVDIQQSSVLGYDALSLIIKAMEKGTAAADIKEGLYSIKNFEIATGTITIDRERGSEKSAFIHLIEKVGGDFVPRIIDEVKP